MSNEQFEQVISDDKLTDLRRQRRNGLRQMMPLFVIRFVKMKLKGKSDKFQVKTKSLIEEDGIDDILGRRIIIVKREGRRREKMWKRREETKRRRREKEWKRIEEEKGKEYKKKGKSSRNRENEEERENE